MFRASARSGRMYAGIRNMSGQIAGGGKKQFNRMPAGAQRAIAGRSGSRGRSVRKYGAMGVGGMLGANLVLGPRPSNSARSGLQPRASGGRGY